MRARHAVGSHANSMPGVITGPAQGHLPALDGLRGLALLIVLVHNSSWIVDPGGVLLLKLAGTAMTAGWAGVQLFFVLSGFLITRLLLEAKGSDGYFRTFYL